MKHILLLFISLTTTAVFALIFCSGAYALKNYGRFLKIEGGRDCIVMRSGEKKRLSVTSALTGLPVIHDKTFCSDNPAVAAVDRSSGIVHAGICGRAYITVTDGRKAGFIWLILTSVIITAAIIFIRKITYTNRCRTQKN
mgnify:CR=1 FL=1